MTQTDSNRVFRITATMCTQSVIINHTLKNPFFNQDALLQAESAHQMVKAAAGNAWEPVTSELWQLLQSKEKQ